MISLLFVLSLKEYFWYNFNLEILRQQRDSIIYTVCWLKYLTALYIRQFILGICMTMFGKVQRCWEVLQQTCTWLWSLQALFPSSLCRLSSGEEVISVSGTWKLLNVLHNHILHLRSIICSIIMCLPDCPYCKSTILL